MSSIKETITELAHGLHRAGVIDEKTMQSFTDEEAAEDMNQKPLITHANHYTLAVTDIDRSFNFYKNILGLKPLCKWPKGAYFLAGDFWFCLNLDLNRTPEPDAHYTHFAFGVAQENFLSMVEKLKQAGVESFKENTSPGDSYYFLDPDGYRLELHVGSWQSRIQAFKEMGREGVEYFV